MVNDKRPSVPIMGEDIQGAGGPGVLARKQILAQRYPCHRSVTGQSEFGRYHLRIAARQQDGSPGGVDGLPAPERSPTRMGARDIVSVRPHRLHQRQIRRLKGLIEKGVGRQNTFIISGAQGGQWIRRHRLTLCATTAVH